MTGATFQGEVHPVAAMFPMLADDELDVLAADIKASGLVFPIVLDADGVLIDGRNRLEACKRAKVKPTFAELDEGRDPVEFILSTNVARRHLSAGQRAMAAANAQEFLPQKKTGAKGAVAATVGVSKARLSYAIAVKTHAPDLADSVLSGAVPLDDAYAEARQRKNAANSTEAKLSKLREEAPDLADLVVEERMKLDEALAAEVARKQKQAEEQRDARSLLSRIVDLAEPQDDDWLDAFADRLGDVDPGQVARVERAGRFLLDLAERLTK